MPYPDLKTILSGYSSVTLGELDSVRLMHRQDTKFPLNASALPELLNELSGSYRILEMDNRREFAYTTRYLDTDEMTFYLQHVTGKLARYKIRYRKYESTGKTFLEIKRKSNKNKTSKWRIENSSSPAQPDEEAFCFIRKHIPFNSFSLHPELENTFTRITLAGLETHERITFDFNMTFTSGAGEKMLLPFLAIAELKSDGYPSWSPFMLTMKQMSIKPAGFSKYCMGTALLSDVPKKNLLKQNMLTLNKIAYEYSKSNGA
jgi:hypothetical protein